MSENWTIKELEAAVKVYIEMRTKSLNGEKFKKKPYYEKLALEFGRTVKSYEYRMQNISYVYSLLGREWLKGLRPATNVGSRVAGEIEAIINALEGQVLSTTAEFEANINLIKRKKSIPIPKGTKEPRKNNTLITQYVRNPDVVAWILNEAKGICECCLTKAPFIKEDNSPFLEVHHLRRLADGGPDTVSNAIAVCPNCHRELHYGKNRTLLIESIYSTIDRIKKR